MANIDNKAKVKFLLEYRKLVLEHERMKRTYQSIAQRFISPVANIQRMSSMPQGNASLNPIQDQYFNLHEMYDLIELLERRIVKKLTEIELAISELQSIQRLILRLRYIDGLSWEEICVKSHYQWAQIHRIHSSALDKIEIGE